MEKAGLERSEASFIEGEPCDKVISQMNDIIMNKDDGDYYDIGFVMPDNISPDGLVFWRDIGKHSMTSVCYDEKLKIMFIT